MAIHGGYLCVNVKKYEGNTSAPKGNKPEAGTSTKMGDMSNTFALTGTKPEAFAKMINTRPIPPAQRVINMKLVPPPKRQLL